MLFIGYVIRFTICFRPSVQQYYI